MLCVSFESSTSSVRIIVLAHLVGDPQKLLAYYLNMTNCTAAPDPGNYIVGVFIHVGSTLKAPATSPNITLFTSEYTLLVVMIDSHNYKADSQVGHSKDFNKLKPSAMYFILMSASPCFFIFVLPHLFFLPCLSHLHLPCLPCFHLCLHRRSCLYSCLALFVLSCPCCFLDRLMLSAVEGTVLVSSSLGLKSYTALALC